MVPLLYTPRPQNFDETDDMDKRPQAIFTALNPSGTGFNIAEVAHLWRILNKSHDASLKEKLEKITCTDFLVCSSNLREHGLDEPSQAHSQAELWSELEIADACSLKRDADQLGCTEDVLLIAKGITEDKMVCR